eukprot:SAG31_NODE_27356_length_427_cov_0.914634_1_plen_74_part_00
MPLLAAAFSKSTRVWLVQLFSKVTRALPLAATLLHLSVSSKHPESKVTDARVSQQQQLDSIATAGAAVFVENE